MSRCIVEAFQCFIPEIIIMAGPGQNLPPRGENILRINSPPGVNFLGKYLPL